MEVPLSLNTLMERNAQNQSIGWKLNLLCLLATFVFGRGIGLLMYIQKFYFWLVIALYPGLILTKRNRAVWQGATIVLCGLFFWYWQSSQQFPVLKSQGIEIR